MSTLAEVLAEIERLKKQADEIVANEKSQVISDIKQKIAAYGITANDLGFKLAPLNPTPAKKKDPIKYQNENGETWSGGRGPKPKWIKKLQERGEDYEKYRIVPVTP